MNLTAGIFHQVPIRGYLTASGTELLLPAYACATVLRARVLPVAVGTPVAIQGDSIEIVESRIIRSTGWALFWLRRLEDDKDPALTIYPMHR